MLADDRIGTTRWADPDGIDAVRGGHRERTAEREELVFARRWNGAARDARDGVEPVCRGLALPLGAGPQQPAAKESGVDEDESERILHRTRARALIHPDRERHWNVVEHSAIDELALLMIRADPIHHRAHASIPQRLGVVVSQLTWRECDRERGRR